MDFDGGNGMLQETSGLSGVLLIRHNNTNALLE